MFILSIVPIHLALNRQYAYTDEIDSARHRILELEALFSALLLRQYLGAQVSGVDNNNSTSVFQMLQTERTQLLNNIDSSNIAISRDDADARIAESDQMSAWVDQRIRDLTMLSDFFAGTGAGPGYYVSGIGNGDFAAINVELNRALSYKAMLQETKDFWIQVANYAPQQSEDTGSSGSVSNNTNSGSVSTNYDYDPRLTLLAISKTRIASLSKLLRSLMNEEPLENIVARERGLMYDLSNEIRKAKDLLIATGINDTSKVSEIRSELRKIPDAKSTVAMVENLQSSIGSELNAALQDYYLF